MKKRLFDMKRSGVKSVHWKLSYEQKEVLSKFFPIIPYLTEISTRPFNNIRIIRSPLLKDVHYAFKKGKMKIVKKIGREEEELLKANHIPHRVIKYEIKLNY